jgi:transcriptional regulator of NAD metabolism
MRNYIMVAVPPSSRKIATNRHKNERSQEELDKSVSGGQTRMTDVTIIHLMIENLSCDKINYVQREINACLFHR